MKNLAVGSGQSQVSYQSPVGSGAVAELLLNADSERFISFEIAES